MCDWAPHETEPASSANDPTRNVPAAASRNANPTVAEALASPSPRSAIAEGAIAMRCAGRTPDWPPRLEPSPSTAVAGDVTSSSSLRITAVLLPVRALASAAVSICSIRPTLCPRRTSSAIAASTPLSGHPTCLQWPTPETVIFQSSAAHPISASSSYSS